MFKSAALEKGPPQSQLYFWADYVELRCIADPDRQFSLDRLTQHFAWAKDLQEVGSDAQDAEEGDVDDLLAELVGPDSEDPDRTELSDALTFEATAEELVGYEDLGRDAEVRDDQRRWSEDVFRLLADRTRMYGNAYPFVMTSDDLTIERRDITDQRLTYLFFLCCSSLRCVDKPTQSELTSSFELVSAETLRSLLPPTAVVDVFGTARGKAASMFTGSLLERITSLAEQLGGTVKVSKGDLHPRETGDKGLDLVAWIPMPDKQSGVPSFFGQCACGADWQDKQPEASYDARWRRLIDLVSPSTTLTFIPHSFRKNGENWYVESGVATIVVDRLRAIRLLSTSGSGTVVPTDLVRSAWDYRLDVV